MAKIEAEAEAGQGEGEAKDEGGQSGGEPPMMVMMVEDEAANLDKLLMYTKTMLGCLHLENVEVCSISLVPQQLRKSKEDVYTPQVLSIGPLHKGTITDLLYMEQTKWRCMLRLLKRCTGEANHLQRCTEEANKVLRSCGEAMLKIDQIVRASYNLDLVNFNPNDLAQIMLLDGCFLLELLITASPELNRKLEYKSNADDSLVAEVIQREKVLSDLTLLENQIPLVVLFTLSRNLFPQIFTEDNSIRLIHENALSILGYNSPNFNTIYSLKFKGFHFLQLVHSFVDRENNAMSSNTEQNTTDVESGVRSRGEKADASPRRIKLERCATRLEAAGVIIKPPKTQNRASNKTRFDLKVTFSNGKLRIPHLYITKTTESKWRNLIAWEVNRATLDKQHEKRKEDTEDRINCQFISYAWFFQSLTCSIHDVKLLRERKVITVEKERTERGEKKIMRNRDLMNLFRNITQEFPEVEIEVDSRFGQVIEKLNSYPAPADRSTATCCKIIAVGVTKPSRIMWHNLRCFLTWIWYKWLEAYGILKNVYIPSGWGLIAVLAAAAGLALTATQTYYAI